MSDPRFARIKTDPRFRKAKKNATKLTVDSRFKSLLQAEEKSKQKGKGRVDKYGRKLKANHEENHLRRFYNLDEDTPARPDYARGEGLIESSSDESSFGGEDTDAEEVVLGRDVTKPIAVLEEEAEVDLDESAFDALDAQAESHIANANEKAREDTQKTTTKPTSRLAIVNLDWDHMKSIHLFKIFSSLFSGAAGNVSDHKHKKLSKGAVLSVRVYPSEFGKKRLEQEDKEGPPPDLFKKPVEDEEDVTVKTLIETNDGQEYDEEALRRYQLERLRYFYAIATFDSPASAQHVYNELDGTELERSANLFDLSYVPEEMDFDAEFRDEASEDTMGVSYQPVEFATDALRHSKVKLTWDDDDPERVRLTRKRLSRKEIEELDFKAYIASSESESDEEGTKKDRERIRNLLLSGNDENLPEGWGGQGHDKAGNMEVTFVPGLSGAGGDSSKDKGAEKEMETTLERYQRKEKEKKQARKAAREASRQVDKEGTKSSGKSNKMEDDFFAIDDDMSEVENHSEPISNKKTKKKNRESKVQPESSTAATEEELALLVESGHQPKHFDVAQILKAEKQAEKGIKKKYKKHGKNKSANGPEVVDDFDVDVADPRFKAVMDDHNFAIDPSNPHFKKTKGMKKLLDARGKRRLEDSQERESKRRKLAG